MMYGEQLALWEPNYLDWLQRNHKPKINNSVDPTKYVYSIYGEDYQNNIVLEELSELAKTVTKYNRKRLKGEPTKSSLEAMAEEVADVEIVLSELKRQYNLQDKVDTYKIEKINRLRERVNTTLGQRGNIYK